MEQCTTVVSDIGYATLLGLLVDHKYATGELCAVGTRMIWELENIKEFKILKYKEAIRSF